MLKYELAKQLKDGGFPQFESHWYWDGNTTPETLWCINILEDKKMANVREYTACPALSELIEACGTDFNNLDAIYSETSTQNRVIVGWIAYGVGRGWNEGTMFDTKEEAVARLWMKLNKK